MSRRTLIVHTGGVGDFICALPALQWLAQRTELEIAGIPERVALGQLAGISRAVHDLEATDFYTVFSEPSERLREFCAPFGEAIVWMTDDDLTITRGLTDAGIGNVQCHPGIPPLRWSKPAARWYSDCMGARISLPFSFPVAPVKGDIDVVLHPGSGNPIKNWPLDSFIELAGRLAESGHRVGWCVGPAEAEAGLAFPGTTLPSMPLAEMAGVLAGARLFVGNDSGIGHLASVAGCPTVTIFGPTDPAVWRPVGPRSAIVCGSPWPSVLAVQESVQPLIVGP